MAALHDYSLIKASKSSFSVHRLMQAATRAGLFDTFYWADIAITLVNAAFPKDSSNVC